MKRKMNLLVLRDIGARRYQFGALMLIVALGISIYVSMSVAFGNVRRSYDRTYEETHFADFTVEVTEAPASVVDEVRQVPNVEAVEGRTVIDTGLPVSEGRLVQARLIGVPTERRPSVNDVVLESGRYFEVGDTAAVLPLDRFADFHHLDAGDTIEVLTGAGLASLEIVGTVASPEYLINAASKQDILPSPRRFGVFFLPESYLEELFQRQGRINEVTILVEDEAQVEETIGAVTGLLDPYGVRQTVRQDDQPSRAATKLDLEGGETFATILPTLVLVVGAFAIYIAMSRLVHAQRTLIGLFRAVGYGSGAIVVHYLLFAVVIALMGGLVGTGAGYGLAYLLTNSYAGALNIPLVTHEFQLMPLVISMAASVAVALVAAATPAWTASRILPAPAMRPSPETALAGGSVPIVERILGLGRRPPMWLRLALRNIWRGPRRTLYTVGAISLGVVLMVVGLASFDSMAFMMDTQFEKTDRWDVVATFWAPQDDATLEEIEGWPGVRRAEPIYMTPAEITAGTERASIQLQALPEDVQLHGFDLGGGRTGSEALAAEGGVVLTEGVADKLGVGRGDEVEIATEGGTAALTVSGVSREAAGGLVYVSLATKEGLLGLSAGFNGVFVETVAPSFDGDVQAALYGLPAIEGAQIKDEIRDDFEEALALFNVLSEIVVVFCLVMAGAIVFNTMTVNVLERERETATMRTLGSGARTVSAILVLEGLAFSLLAIAPGLILGTIAASYVIETFSSDFFTMWFHMRTLTYSVIAGITIVAALVSTLPSVWHSNRLDLAEATKVLT